MILRFLMYPCWPFFTVYNFCTSLEHQLKKWPKPTNVVDMDTVLGVASSRGPISPSTLYPINNKRNNPMSALDSKRPGRPKARSVQKWSGNKLTNGRNIPLKRSAFFFSFSYPGNVIWDARFVFIARLKICWKPMIYVLQVVLSRNNKTFIPRYNTTAPSMNHS